MENGKLIFSTGTHFVDPLIVEVGKERRLSIVLEADTKLYTTAFVLAIGSEAKLSLTVDLAGEGAEFYLHALYIASGAGKSEESGRFAGYADIDVKINHLAPKSISRQLIKGIAADSATGSFTGMVHVALGAQHTDASQRNQNLQLTDTAHVFARPQLEIYADDVKCSHGATVGRLDEEAVHYMRQRGVSEAEARRLQMQGFAGEIINHCPSESFRDIITARISKLLDRF